MPLHPSNVARLSSLDRQAVEKTCAQIGKFVIGGKLLGPRNRYASNTINTISAEHSDGHVSRPKQLRQYIVASSITHALDGWSYFGKSTLALLRGDPHRARHLAYYAELRAAMSILATEGIGVFNKHHFLIDGFGSVSEFPIPSTTHQFVWDCLVEWAGMHHTTALFADQVKAFGLSASTWVHAIGDTSQLAPHVKNWFLEWGMDLQTLPDDRNARNESSYRPDGIPDIWFEEAGTTIDFCKQLWVELEPSPSSSFGNLDRTILRISIEKLFTARTGKSHLEDSINFEDFVNVMLNQSGLDGATKIQASKYLLRATSPKDPQIFSLAKTPPNFRNGSVFSMMSRATLLLRFASGLVSHLFQVSGSTLNRNEFWVGEIGINRGLWKNQSVPTNLLDLWSDVDNHFQAIEDFLLMNQADQSFHSMSEEPMASAVLTLASFERVGLWSMCD